MEHDKLIKEAQAVYATSIENLDDPIFLERDGQPVAVLMSMKEYTRFQTIADAKTQLSAIAARRAADKALLRDFVGTALTSNAPLFVDAPSACWRVPYRFLDGTLVAIIEVDAYTGKVDLTVSDRDEILTQVEKLAIQHASTKTA